MESIRNKLDISTAIEILHVDQANKQFEGNLDFHMYRDGKI